MVVKKKEEVSEVENDQVQTRASGIIVRDPEMFRPKQLPLIVVLPEGASKAQIERAKVLNGFAYQFPEKWKVEKETQLKLLEELADAPDPVEDKGVAKVGSAVPKEV